MRLKASSACWAAAVTACAVAVGCRGLGSRRAGPTRYRRLSESALAQIRDYDQWRVPWHKATKTEFRLRRRLFALQDRLLRTGETVWPPGAQYWFEWPGEYWAERRAACERLAKALELTYEGPRKFVSGEEPTAQVTLTNRSDKTLRLLIWGKQFESEILHPSGHVPVRIIPAWRLIAGGHVRPPGKDDYVTLAPGESARCVVPLLHRTLLLPPGRYHLLVAYVLPPAVADVLGLRSAESLRITTPVVPVQFVLASQVNGLSCSLSAEHARIKPGEPLTFKAQLWNPSKCEWRTVHRPSGHPISLRRGRLLFGDPASGEERSLMATVRPAPHIEPDAWNPHFPRRHSYVHLAPEQALDLTLAVSPDELKKHSDLLRPGRPVEVTWHYENARGWFIEDGKVFQWGNIWRGHIRSEPVRLHW